jgi:hypothetical protein
MVILSMAGLCEASRSTGRIRPRADRHPARLPHHDHWPGRPLPAARRARADRRWRACEHQHHRRDQRFRAGRRAGWLAAHRGWRGPPDQRRSCRRRSGRGRRAHRGWVHSLHPRSPLFLAGENCDADPREASGAVGHLGRVPAATARVDDRGDDPAATEHALKGFPLSLLARALAGAGSRDRGRNYSCQRADHLSRAHRNIGADCGTHGARLPWS